MDVLEQVFGVRKPVIAMLHFPGLPGRPRHDRSAGVNAAVDLIGRDLEALRRQGSMACCSATRQTSRISSTSGRRSAAMAAVIGQVRRDLEALRRQHPVGCEGESCAGSATGASFIREVLTGVYERPRHHRAAHRRRRRVPLGDRRDDVRLFDNIAPEFSSSLGRRSVADRARGAAFLGMDAILISGPAAGVQFEMSDLQAAHDAVGDQVPIIANTGVTAERLPDIFRVADGVIVGTSLKRDGVTWNPVDAERAARLMQVAREARAASPAGSTPG